MLTADKILAALSYDPATGQLTWQDRARSEFATDRQWKFWNTKYAGKPALQSKNAGGYCAGKLSQEFLSAHRAAYVCMTGRLPDGEIDHINGNRTDNRWQNLRCVSKQVNRRNKSAYKSNKSGSVGVHFLTREQKWAAKIGNKRLGVFSCKSAAIIARNAAQARAGNYTARHGQA